MIAMALSCTQPTSPTPEAAYATFALALRKGDTKTAWNALSSATKRAAQTRAQEISQSSHGMIKDEPALMLFQTGVKPLQDMEIVGADSRSADETWIRVRGANGVQTVRMIREANQWTIDLSELLAK